MKQPNKTQKSGSLIYEVVSANYIHDLIERVQQRLDEGFVPLGGLISTSDSLGYRFYQTMLRSCPACRGYNLERQWCDTCGRRGVIHDSPNKTDGHDDVQRSGVIDKHKYIVWLEAIKDTLDNDQANDILDALIRDTMRLW